MTAADADAGVAEMQRLRSELAQRDTELSIVNGIHEGMVARLGFQAIVELVGEQLRATLDTEDIGIRWHDPASNLVHFLFEYERGVRQQIEPRPLARGGAFDQIMKTRKPLVFNSGDDAAPASGESLAWILVPIIGSDRVCGTIVLEDYKRAQAFGETQVRLLTTVAGSMGVALENAKLFDETQRLFKESERRTIEDMKRLEIALAQQMELNSLRSSFVSMTSHEFRTPLTSIKSSQELLHHYHDRLEPQERAEILVSIDAAVERMLRMLDQVLTLGRADAQMFQFRPGLLKLDALCQQLADEAVTTAATRGPGKELALPRIDFSFQAGDATVTADEKLLRHVLSNLLSNAIKYSPQTAAASFRVVSEDGELVFEVADSGIGIPAEDLPHLFDSYRRGANVGDIPGTGLGLAIVKRAVETHGGTIEVSSEIGRGTCFTVRIPLA